MDSFLNKPATSSSSTDNETLLDDILTRIKANDRIVCERIQLLERATGAYAHTFISNALKNNPKEVIAILHEVLKDHPVYFDSLTEGLKQTVDADHERLDAMAKEFHATQQTLHHQISVHEKMMGVMKEHLDSMGQRLEYINFPDAASLYPRIITREMFEKPDTIELTNPVPTVQASAGYLSSSVAAIDDIISGGSNMFIGCRFTADGSVYVGDVPPRMTVSSPSSSSEQVSTHVCADVNVLYPAKYKVGKGPEQDAYMADLHNNAQVAQDIIRFIYQTWWGECPDKIEEMKPDEGDEIATMADVLFDFYKGLVDRFANYKKVDGQQLHYSYNVREALNALVMACINFFHERIGLPRTQWEENIIKAKEGKEYAHILDKPTYDIPMIELHKLGVAALKLEKNIRLVILLEKGDFYIAHFDFMEYFNGINKLAYNFQQFIYKHQNINGIPATFKEELLNEIEKHSPVFKHISVIDSHYKHVIGLIDSNNFFLAYAEMIVKLTPLSVITFLNSVAAAVRNSCWVYFGIQDTRDAHNYIAWRLMGAVRDANTINAQNAETVCSKIANAFIAVCNIILYGHGDFKLNYETSSMFHEVLDTIKNNIGILQLPAGIKGFCEDKAYFVKYTASIYDVFISLISLSFRLEYPCSNTKDLELSCATILMQIRFQFNSLFSMTQTKKRNRDTKVRIHLSSNVGKWKMMVLDNLHTKLDYISSNLMVTSVRDAVTGYRNAFLACFGANAWHLKANQLPWTNGAVEADKLMHLSKAIVTCISYLLSKRYKTADDYHQLMDTFSKKYLRTNCQAPTFILDFLQYRFNLLSEIGILAFAVKNIKFATRLAVLFVNLFTTSTTCGTHNLYFYDSLFKQAVYSIHTSKDEPFVYSEVATINFPDSSVPSTSNDFLKDEIKNMDGMLSSHSDAMETMKRTIESQQEEIETLRANLIKLSETMERLQECIADKVADDYQEEETEPEAKAQKP